MEYDIAIYAFFIKKLYFLLTTRIKKKKNINLARIKFGGWRISLNLDKLYKIKRFEEDKFHHSFYEIKFQKFEFTVYFYNFIYRIYISIY